jgi:hypothetical protein
MTMAESIGSIIQQWLRDNGYDEKLREHSVPSYWVDIVGEAVARQAEVERIVGGRMFVRVEAAAWRNINDRFGAEVVREIVLR